MKNNKSVIFMVLFAIGFSLSVVCYSKALTGYAILFLTVSVLFGLFGGYQFIQGKNPKSAYENEVKNILNTYDSILLKCNTVPNFDNRNIIRVESMDDLVDAQFEIRKPICYLKQSESCSFMLLDEKEVYVYIAKLNEEELSPAEIEINNMKYRKKSNSDMDSEMLQDIEKTTIVKLSNKKSYRISPIRKKEEEKKESMKASEYEAEYLFDEEELKDVQPVKDDIEVLDL